MDNIPSNSTHAFAIVDEVDSILIDEARTPLIISGKGEDSSSLYTQVDRFARTLRKSVVVELEDKVSTDEQADGDYVVPTNSQYFVYELVG